MNSTAALLYCGAAVAVFTAVPQAAIQKKLFHIFLLRLFYCGRRSSRPKWLPKASPKQSFLRRNSSVFIRPVLKSGSWGVVVFSYGICFLTHGAKGPGIKSRWRMWNCLKKIRKEVNEGGIVLLQETHIKDESIIDTDIGHFDENIQNERLCKILGENSPWDLLTFSKVKQAWQKISKCF